MLVEILGIRIDFTHILGATNNPAGLTYRNIVGEEGRRTAVDFGNDRLIRVLVDDLAIEQRAVPRRRTRGRFGSGCGLSHGLQPFNMRIRSGPRSEEHTSELQSLMRISYAVFCLKKKTKDNITLQT